MSDPTPEPSPPTAPSQPDASPDAPSDASPKASLEASLEASPDAGEPRRAVAWFGWGLVAVLASYLIVFPLAEWVVAAIAPEEPPRGSYVIPDMSVAEQIRVRTTSAFVGVLVFAVGASIGSFLNVLAYRQPLGLSVLTQPSHCPACKTQIESRDNVPVVGWLKLGGRCRACGVPISARYPLVETICGMLLIGLFFGQLAGGGANLPVRNPMVHKGLLWTVLYPKWDLIGLTAYHYFLLAMLLVWLLMAIDRQRVPWRSSVPAVLAAALASLIWPKLVLMPPGIGEANYPFELSTVVLVLILGGFAGLLVGAVLALVSDTPMRTTAAATVLIGVTLGWQAVLLIGLTMLPVAIAATVLDNRFPAEARLLPALLTVTVTHHAIWRTVSEYVLLGMAALG